MRTVRKLADRLFLTKMMRWRKKGVNIQNRVRSAQWGWWLVQRKWKLRESVIMSARFITQLMRKNSGRFHHHLPGRRSIMNEAVGLDISMLGISETSSPKVPHLKMYISLAWTNSRRCDNGKYELADM